MWPADCKDYTMGWGLEWRCGGLVFMLIAAAVFYRLAQRKEDLCFAETNVSA